MTKGYYRSSQGRRADQYREGRHRCRRHFLEGVELQPYCLSGTQDEVQSLQKLLFSPSPGLFRRSLKTTPVLTERSGEICHVQAVWKGQRVLSLTLDAFYLSFFGDIFIGCLSTAMEAFTSATKKWPVRQHTQDMVGFLDCLRIGLRAHF